MNTVTQTETDVALRTRALESLLIEKGLITTEMIDEVVEKYEKDVGPLNGARVVARAWDSNSDLRYMVLPERPAGTEDYTEEQLIPLVTRDSMIGVAKIESPSK